MHPDLIKKVAEDLLNIGERLRDAERVRLSRAEASRDRTSTGEPMNALDSTQVRPDLVDRMIELYCDWRTGCAEVQAAYERFLDASASDRTTAFAAYLAALDREQCACESYAEQVRLVASRFTAQTERTRRRETPGR